MKRKNTRASAEARVFSFITEGGGDGIARFLQKGGEEQAGVFIVVYDQNVKHRDSSKKSDGSRRGGWGCLDGLEGFAELEDEEHRGKGYR